MLAGGLVPAASGASTLARVRAAGVLACGVDQEEPEYSTSDDHGSREAFDEDLCHAVAVAVLGEHARVRVVDYPDDQSSMEELQCGRGGYGADADAMTLRMRWERTWSLRGRCCGMGWGSWCWVGARRCGRGS